MVNPNDIAEILEQHTELWCVIEDSGIHTYPQHFCIFDDEFDGYDYTGERKLYMLFYEQGHHEFVALYVPEEYTDRADECPVLFVDPETIDDETGEICGSANIEGNIKSYLTDIINQYIESPNRSDNPEYLQECKTVLKKIENYSDNLLDLPNINSNLLGDNLCFVYSGTEKENFITQLQMWNNFMRIYKNET